MAKWPIWTPRRLEFSRPCTSEVLMLTKFEMLLQCFRWQICRMGGVWQLSSHVHCSKHKSARKISHSKFRNGFEIFDERPFLSIKSFTVLLSWSRWVTDGHHRLPLTELEEEVWNQLRRCIPIDCFLTFQWYCFLMHYCPSFNYSYFIISRSNHNIINWLIWGSSRGHGVLEYIKRWTRNNNQQLGPLNLKSLFLF